MSASPSPGAASPIHPELVSVTIPSYNRERYVVEAIESVLAQDHRPLELIVVDDGSTDGTARAVERFGSSIRYHRQENRGFAAARNAGVALARGPFLAFLDSDDLWLPDKLSRQMAIFRARPRTEAVYGHAEQFFSPELEPAARARIRSGATRLAAPCATALLIRRSAFERVGLFDTTLNIGVEMDWYARAMDAAVDVVDLPEVVCRRRLHASNLNLVHAAEQSERLHVLKAVLDRRRRAAESIHHGEPE